MSRNTGSFLEVDTSQGTNGIVATCDGKTVVQDGTVCENWSNWTTTVCKESKKNSADYRFNGIRCQSKTVTAYQWYKNTKSYRSYYPSNKTSASDENTYYLSAPASGYIKDENVIWALYSMYDKFAKPNIEGLKEQYPECKIIGLYHGDIAGAVTEVGRMSESGIDTNVFKECDCVMAGHIHKHQEIKKNGVPIVYSGSVFQQNSGENTTGHGFVIWDIDKMKYKLHEVKNNYKIYKFKITSYEDVKDDVEKLLNL